MNLFRYCNGLFHQRVNNNDNKRGGVVEKIKLRSYDFHDFEGIKDG